MSDSIEKYLNKSKNDLNTILSNLETNIEFLDNELWNSYDEISDTIKDIINIYYDKYYLYTSNDYSKIDKYIKFNNKINRKLKTILLSIIDYYESINEGNKIKACEGSILYLTILIYLSIVLYEKDFNLIDTPKKIEKVINNIIDNFARIRFKSEKDLVLLISNIKKIILENNNFNDYINSLNSDESHNDYICVNKDSNFYKIIYEYNIKELNDYEDRDINIVNEKMNIGSILTKISYNIAYYTMFKLMKNGKDLIMLLPIRKKDLLDEEIRKYIFSHSDLINKNMKFLINYNELAGDYEFVNLMKADQIDVFIELNEPIETDNYNMFMDISNVVVPEEFLSINDKYVEIWKDMNMNFVVKNLGERLSEGSLISRK